MAENIPGGEYELLIFAHNCLSNIKDPSDIIERMDVNFRIDINFIKWTKNGDFAQYPLYLDVSGKSSQILIDSLDFTEF